jgi:hypothetical protein
VVLGRTDRLEEAIDAYEVAIAEGVTEAILNQGVELELIGRTGEARRRYLEAVEAGDALGHLRLGALAVKDGDPGGSRAAFRPGAGGRLVVRTQCVRDPPGPGRAMGGS